jgi:hypothetical protein
VRLAFVLLLTLLAIPCTASRYEFLEARAEESVLHFIAVDRRVDAKVLIWVKTIFSPPKTIVIDGPKREIVPNHVQSVSGWEIDCSLRSGILVTHIAYGINGNVIQGYSAKSFAIDFLGADASPISFVNVATYRQLDGDMSATIVNRACM